MNTDKIDEASINRITESIIGCVYKVANGLGSDFLEKVYENALVHELTKSGLHVSQQHRIDVVYDGVVVGEYIADLIVERWIAVGLKQSKPLRISTLLNALII